jgi:hypothetical protein
MKIGSANLEKLFDALEKAGHPVEWNEDGTEIEMCLTDADFEISKSAGGYYSIKKTPYFAEPEYYAVDNIETVLDIVEE